MTKTFHHFYLVQQTLHSLGYSVKMHFGKTFHCVPVPRLETFHFEDRGKLPFPQSP